LREGIIYPTSSPLRGRLLHFVSPLEGNIPQHEPLEARIYFSHLLPLDGRIIPSFISSPLRGED